MESKRLTWADVDMLDRRRPEGSNSTIKKLESNHQNFTSIHIIVSHKPNHPSLYKNPVPQKGLSHASSIICLSYLKV